MNVHDSERMAGLLEQAGFEATEGAADAGVVVINTCSVRERAGEKLYTRLGELRPLAAGQGHDPTLPRPRGGAAQERGTLPPRPPGGCGPGAPRGAAARSDRDPLRRARRCGV